MEPARVRFLEEGEEPVLPKWTKLLPQRWRQRKTVDTYPYTLTRVDGVLTGILQAERTAVLTADWRRGAVRLLAALEEAGAAIIVPPAEGEFPRERLPFAEGRRLAQLFAFAGAAEALRRQGRNPEESAFLLAGASRISGEGAFPLWEMRTALPFLLALERVWCSGFMRSAA
ncbi:MAG: hypothetical protein ACLUD9_06135 [Anaerotignum faecicola]